MKRRILPLLLGGVPCASQNSMRLPVPVCTLTMMSEMIRLSLGFSTPSQPGYQTPLSARGSVDSGEVAFQSSL